MFWCAPASLRNIAYSWVIELQNWATEEILRIMQPNLSFHKRIVSAPNGSTCLKVLDTSGCWTQLFWLPIITTVLIFRYIALSTFSYAVSLSLLFFIFPSLHYEPVIPTDLASSRRSLRKSLSPAQLLSHSMHIPTHSIFNYRRVCVYYPHPHR